MTSYTSYYSNQEHLLCTCGRDDNLRSHLYNFKQPEEIIEATIKCTMKFNLEDQNASINWVAT